MRMSSSCGSGSPCGACKFLRRKCASDCVFGPYFSNEHGAVRFAAIHKVFGASNASKMLLQVPEHSRSEAVVSIAYEAQARLRDPVYGCVAHIFSLQQQVASLQAQLMLAKAQLARSSSMEINRCQGNYNSICNSDLMQPYYELSPQSSLECSIDNNSTGELSFEDNFNDHNFSAARILNNGSRRATTTYGVDNELHALASRMMRNF